MTPPQPAPAANIVPHAPLTIEEIGAVGQQPMTRLSGVTDKLTQNARGADLDEVGKLLGNLLVTAKGYDPTKLGKGGGISGLFRWGQTKAQQIQNNFTSVDTQVDQLLTQIDQRVVHFKNRIPDLNQMRADTIQFHKDLDTEMARMNERISWMEANPPADDVNDPFSASKKAQWNQVIQMGRKRVDDLRRVQILAEQQVPQIDLMIVNCSSLSQKFTDIKATTIPAWKQLFAAYIVQLEIQKGAEMAEAVDNSFNEALKKAADLSHSNTVKVQQSLQRSTVDLATIEYTQRKLLDAIDQVGKIAEEGKARLAAERPKLEALSKELNDKLRDRK